MTSPPTAAPCAPCGPPRAAPNQGGGIPLALICRNQAAADEWFEGLFEAYTRLAAGEQRALVKVADRDTRYSRGDLPALKELLATISPFCSPCLRRLRPGRAGVGSFY
jgi:hypothetical protein